MRTTVKFYLWGMTTGIVGMALGGSLYHFAYRGEEWADGAQYEARFICSSHERTLTDGDYVVHCVDDGNHVSVSTYSISVVSP
jgi:hypothetical protein